MKVEFRKSFEKDLGKIRDGDLLAKIKSVVEEVENAENLLDVNNTKKFTTVFELATIELALPKIKM